MKKIYVFICMFFLIISDGYASLEIQGKNQDIQQLVSIEKGVVVIDADIIIWDYYRLEYPLKVLWNVEIKTHVQLLEDIEVTGDIHIGDYVKSYGKISAKNIYSQNGFRWDLLYAQNIELGWNNTVVWWVNVQENFSAWSNLLLKWNTFIWGDFQASMWAEVEGNLVVLWNAKGHFDFIFDGKKMVVRGNFRTLEDSKVSGRIYMFASQWHKYKYGNEIWKYRYHISNTTYRDFFGALDPFLQYDLSDKKLASLRNVIQKYDWAIRNVQDETFANISELSSDEIWEKYKQAQKLLTDKFEYISWFVWDNSWQETQVRILKYQQEQSLQEVFAQLQR